MTTILLAVRRGRTRPAFRPPTLDNLPIWAGAAAATMGIVVLLGWIFDSDILKSMIRGLPTMKANAASCFVLLGVGVILLARAGARSTSRLVGLVAVGVAAAIAIVTGTEYVTNVDLGIDQFLFREHASAVATGVAGRMSPLTAICFALLAVAAVVGTRAPRIVVGLSGVALAMSVLNVFTFVFEARGPAFLAGYSQMALGSALAMGVTYGVGTFFGTAAG